MHLYRCLCIYVYAHNNFLIKKIIRDFQWKFSSAIILLGFLTLIIIFFYLGEYFFVSTKEYMSDYFKIRNITHNLNEVYAINSKLIWKTNKMEK